MLKDIITKEEKEELRAGCKGKYAFEKSIHGIDSICRCAISFSGKLKDSEIVSCGYCGKEEVMGAGTAVKVHYSICYYHQKDSL